MENAQERGLSAGTSEAAAVEAVRRRKRASMYGAQIWDPLRRNNVWLGTFATAMDAAEAYDAAAVELHGAAAQTNFKIPAAGRSSASVAAESAAQEQGLGAGECEVAEERMNCVKAVERRKEKALPEPDATRTEFRGVWWQPSGAYLGTFVAAEDYAAVKLPCVKKATCRPYNRTGFRGVPKEAGRAYNTAAIKLHGGAAKTNFKSPAAGDINPEHVQMICLKQAPVAAKVNSNVEVRRRAVVRSDCRSGFRGVGLYNGRYIAQIREPRRPTTRQQLGIFDNVEDAARAYDAAALRLYGAAARTNFEQPPTGATADDLPELPLRSSTISASPACCRVPQGDGLH